MSSYAHQNGVHPAQVAGFFYPADVNALRTLIATMRDHARPDGGVAPKAVVAPHAGIVYSGAVAATAFGPWARRSDPPRRIVIAGPAHRVAFRGLAIHPAMAWMTPLGEAKVARDLHIRLAEARAAAVDARPFAGEHSLEMHLVMLQAMLPAPFEILPILVGDAEPRRVAEALRLVWGGPETAIAISSDLSHFLDRASAEAIDSETGRLIETLEAASLHGRRACGFLPIMGALDIAAERDMRASGLHLATSADVGADASRVVGYGAFAIEYAASARLAEADRDLLLSTAMAGLATAARRGGETPSLAVDGRLSPALTSMRASFVTLTQSGKLRGCIGSAAPRRSLIDDVMTNAVQSGFSDPRFQPLTEADLDSLSLDVSILSHPRSVPARSEAQLAAALEPDRDGLILGVGRRRALFLPSVWRQLPDGREFVQQLMQKASLDGWPARIEATCFRVETFGAPWRRIEPGDIAPARIDEPPRALH
ncbi:MAG: AmmeMemoRadiSam system protein B [Hyphomicrobiales bacterium]|nr:AmmeMemoRadiSam system protein B [Hyphomicrobiales bacterium]